MGQKTEHKMKIHESRIINKSNENDIHKQQCFYNYFDFGLDILFDLETYKATKFIVHSNAPSHSDFCQYSRCNFLIVLIKDDNKEKDEKENNENNNNDGDDIGN